MSIIGNSMVFSSLTKTQCGKSYEEHSRIFCALSFSIRKSTAIFPTLPTPGNPSIRIGFLNATLATFLMFHVILLLTLLFFYKALDSSVFAILLYFPHLSSILNLAGLVEIHTDAHCG